MAIEFPENQKQASQYVREAIPMMVSKKIVPNPFNFTLWYAYVSNRDTKLKTELDNVVSIYGTCPEEVSRDLFQKYVIDDELTFQKSLEDSLDHLIVELLDEVDETKATTDTLAQTYTDNLQLLNKGQNEEQLFQTTKTLIDTTTQAGHLVDTFKNQLQAAEEEIRNLKKQLEIKALEAYVDPLTQIGNRRAYEKKAYELFAAPRSDVSVIMLDLDHFKSLNDTRGHLVGDKVLQAIGTLLKQQETPAISVYRYGGEEFAILVENTAHQAAELAEKLRQNIEKLKLRNRKTDSTIGGITASMGIAQREPGETLELCVTRADSALYQAKASGRNRVECA